MILYCRNSVRIPIRGNRNHHRQFVGVTLIDRADEPRVNQTYWYRTATGYACSWKHGRLSRWLLGLPKGDQSGRVEVDHINGNKLDNRRGNLRIVNRSTNDSNRRGPQSNNTSGILGVSPHSGGWQGQINVQGESYRKWFKLKEDAITWRKGMEIKLNHKGLT